MDTSTIVCLGIVVATVVAFATLTTLSVLSRASKDDAHLKQLIQKHKEDHE